MKLIISVTLCLLRLSVCTNHALKREQNENDKTITHRQIISIKKMNTYSVQKSHKINKKSIKHNFNLYKSYLSNVHQLTFSMQPTIF